MSMRVTIRNDEPGFSDARLFVQTPQGKRVLYGGQEMQVIMEPNVKGQVRLQCGRRAGDDRDDTPGKHQEDW